MGEKSFFRLSCFLSNFVVLHLMNACWRRCGMQENSENTNYERDSDRFITYIFQNSPQDCVIHILRHFIYHHSDIDLEILVWALCWCHLHDIWRSWDGVILRLSCGNAIWLDSLASEISLIPIPMISKIRLLIDFNIAPHLFWHAKSFSLSWPRKVAWLQNQPSFPHFLRAWINFWCDGFCGIAEILPT